MTEQCTCGHPVESHCPDCEACDCFHYEEDDQTMVDCGGGMLVPLRELMSDD